MRDDADPALMAQAHGRLDGGLALIDDLALFDRIRTEEPHRRRGLGSVVMTTLGRLADEAGAARWALAATAAGRALYETVGWEVHAPRTTASLSPRS